VSISVLTVARSVVVITVDLLPKEPSNAELCSSMCSNARSRIDRVVLLYRVLGSPGVPVESTCPLAWSHFELSREIGSCRRYQPLVLEVHACVGSPGKLLVPTHV
jgi:hypothetical protein